MIKMESLIPVPVVPIFSLSIERRRERDDEVIISQIELAEFYYLQTNQFLDMLKFPRFLVSLSTLISGLGPDLFDNGAWPRRVLFRCSCMYWLIQLGTPKCNFFPRQSL